MTTDRDHQADAAADHQPTAMKLSGDAHPMAGQGRLARLLATRGGVAAPEAPFVIEHREALIYMLCEAAELEHGIMCQYLFAAFSLKESQDEGLTADELTAVTRWQRQILNVAAGEMLHLALVHNMLSAIGAAPHLSRPNLPAPAGHYPAAVQLALLPFGDQALRHFMFLERPEGMDLNDAEGLAAMQTATPSVSPRDIVPTGQDFATVGHLYRSIEAGFRHLTDKYGEDWLFTGPPRAQATPAHFGWPNLLRVTGLDSACAAVEEIVEQGEGPRGYWRNAHFGQFVEILDEYQRMRAANPGFEPTRPVMAANVRPHERVDAVPMITDPLTARVTDLFNVAYEILLQLFGRFFAHTTETDGQLKVLADASVTLMMLPSANDRAQLRAVLRIRLPDAAPARGLGAGGRAARRGGLAVRRTVRRARRGPRRPPGAGPRRDPADRRLAGRAPGPRSPPGGPRGHGAEAARRRHRRPGYRVHQDPERDTPRCLPRRRGPQSRRTARRRPRPPGTRGPPSGRRS